jgi:hypothetical protein
VPKDIAPGTYRITHRGGFKAETDRKWSEFEAHSGEFAVQ